jgi:hypothetical protein
MAKKPELEQAESEYSDSYENIEEQSEDLNEFEDKAYVFLMLD